MTPACWLIDRSVLVRLCHDPVAEVVFPRLRAGLVGVALVTELEVDYSARSTRDYVSPRDDVLVQVGDARPSVDRGGPGPPGAPGLGPFVILDYDHDVDLITEVTGQPTEWVVPRGSVA